MKSKFILPNSSQRKYLSGLAAVACVAWATPVYSFLTSLHLHELSIKTDYVIFLLASFVTSLFMLLFGYNILDSSED